nr:hypothetical protein BaRGS_015384 [Batillaria attramentaria]
MITSLQLVFVALDHMVTVVGASKQMASSIQSQSWTQDAKNLIRKACQWKSDVFPLRNHQGKLGERVKLWGKMLPTAKHVKQTAVRELLEKMITDKFEAEFKAMDSPLLTEEDIRLVSLLSGFLVHNWREKVPAKKYVLTFIITWHPMVNYLKRFGDSRSMDKMEVLAKRYIKYALDLNPWRIPDEILALAPEIQRAFDSVIFTDTIFAKIAEKEKGRLASMTFWVAFLKLWDTVNKEWKKRCKQMIDGSISLAETEKMFNMFRPEGVDCYIYADIEKELKKMAEEGPFDWVEDRIRQFHCYTDIKNYVDAAGALIKVRNTYKIAGDFQEIEKIQQSSTGAAAPISGLDDTIRGLCSQLEDIRPADIDCLKKFTDCIEFVNWLKQTMKEGVKELKVFVELALISAGDDPLAVDRVDTSNELVWFQDVQKTHGSVEKTSLSQVANIIARGVFKIISEKGDMTMKVQDVIRVDVRKDEETKTKGRSYKYNELLDLQSRLMLVAGQAEKGKEDVDRFITIMDSLVRLGKTYVQLCGDGCVLFLNWAVNFLCDKERKVCCTSEFSGQEMLKGTRGNEDLEDYITEVAAFLERCHKEWMEYVDKKRQEYPELNMYTVEQLDCIPKDLGEALEEAMDEVDRMKELKRKDQQAMAKKEEEKRTTMGKIDDYLRELTNLTGCTKAMALKALEEIGEPDVSKALDWCLAHDDDDDNDGGQAEDEEEQAGEVPEKKEVGQKLKEWFGRDASIADSAVDWLQKMDTGDDTLAAMIGNLSYVWKKFLETVTSSGADFLSLEHLGVVLGCLAKKAEVLSAVTYMYMFPESSDTPLPQPDEVLLCTDKTTFEQADIFLRRAFFGKKKKVHCLAFADSLSYDVGEKAEKKIKEYDSQTESGYRLVVVCTSENEYRAHIVAALSRYFRRTEAVIAFPEVRKHLTKRFAGVIDRNGVQSASSLDPERLCVRVVKSRRSGVGKTLYKTRLGDRLKRSLPRGTRGFSVSIPLHCRVANTQDIAAMLLEHTLDPEHVLPRIIHIDISYQDFASRSLKISEQSLAALVTEEIDIEEYKMERTWENSPHPYIFFNPDGNTMTFLGFSISPKTFDMKDQQTGIVLDKAIMTRELYVGLKRNGAPVTENFDNLSRLQRLQRLYRAFGLRDDEMYDENGQIYDPDDTYELTTDNVKKILAIYMRFRCDIPVIVMGETGCGKTRLIKFLCALQTPHRKKTETMVLVKVHGGTTADDVMLKVREAEAVARENKATFKHEHRPLYTVLFFDEANTTEAVGAIKEVMCDGTMAGKPISLDKSLKLVAACNPYRRHTPEMIKRLESAGLGYHVDAEDTVDKLGRVPMRHLVYRVHPLPQSMLPQVWDFGQLDARMEELYIRQMVRRYDECSFVSLRDVERTLTVFSWFLMQAANNNVLFKRLEKKLQQRPGDEPDVLDDTQESSEDEGDFYDVFLDNVRLEENIARNQALKDNVFMMVVCIELRIPLFLVGKPGSSKSLAKTIVSDAMQGNMSHSELFRKLKQTLHPLLEDGCAEDGVPDDSKKTQDAVVGAKVRTLVPKLADAYLKIFEEAEKSREFFGLRDFYSLVKMVYAFAAHTREEPTKGQLIAAIRRNFGGSDKIDPVEFFQSVLPKHFFEKKSDQDPDYSPTGLIKAALHGDNMGSETRYLLLLTENYGGLNILLENLLADCRRVVPIFGSSFPKDQEYTKICCNINRIKVCMETGQTVILLNLENLYESLYDALNQVLEESQRLLMWCATPDSAVRTLDSEWSKIYHEEQQHEHLAQYLQACLACDPKKLILAQGDVFMEDIQVDVDSPDTPPPEDDLTERPTQDPATKDREEVEQDLEENREPEKEP